MSATEVERLDTRLNSLHAQLHDAQRALKGIQVTTIPGDDQRPLINAELTVEDLQAQIVEAETALVAARREAAS